MGCCCRKGGIEELVDRSVLPGCWGEHLITESANRMEISVGADITNECGHQLADIGELALADVEELTDSVVTRYVVADGAVGFTNVTVNDFHRHS